MWCIAILTTTKIILYKFVGLLFVRLLVTTMKVNDIISIYSFELVTHYKLSTRNTNIKLKLLWSDYLLHSIMSSMLFYLLRNESVLLFVISLLITLLTFCRTQAIRKIPNRRNEDRSPISLGSLWAVISFWTVGSAMALLIFFILKWLPSINFGRTCSSIFLPAWKYLAVPG